MQINRIPTAKILILALIFLASMTSCHDRTGKGELAINFENRKLAPPNDSHSLGDFTIDEPISQGNLQVFLIHGKEGLGEKTYTTLSSALQNKKVTVKETGDVNQLSISNYGNAHVFIHTGDIVKGGKQDRTIAQDVIIPPGAKNVPLESFCVEQGRWQQREGEEVARFESTENMLSSRKLKMAARYDKNQGQVWQNIAEEQSKLGEKVSIINGYSVAMNDEISKTSLQLTLESKELKKAKSKLDEKFASLVENKETAIGYAYAINGEIYGIDVYNNKKLFDELWGKIAESIIVESVSNLEEKKAKAANKSDVTVFMNAVNTKDRKKSVQVINEATVLEILENEKENVVFSTIDKDENNWIHTNYMKKNNQQNGSKESGINFLDQRRNQN